MNAARRSPIPTAAVSALALALLGATQQGGSSAPVDLAIKSRFDVPVTDAQSEAIVAAARAFLETLSDSQRETAVFAFSDNAQRSNWSNLPDGLNVRRGGVARGDLSGPQRAALDALIAELLSEDGVANVVHQLVAEDSLNRGGSRPNFGNEFYFASFLGEPSTTEPWMFQFGGHHLAINATIFGPHVSFAPMLTGGQPMRISYEGRAIVIAERETAAAQAFMDSLTDAQEERAIRGTRAINLLLGPGRDGTVLAPEGIEGGALSDAQKTLLLAVIRARLGFINDDDFAARMATVEAEIDETWFGWWGPRDAPGTAYYRVTGPSIVLEYAPQGSRGGLTDHVHSMYREPGNDYGALWIRAE